MRPNTDLRGADYLNGRDLIAHHDDLAEQSEYWESECEEWATEPPDTRGEKPEDPLTEDEREELAALAEIQNEISNDLCRKACVSISSETPKRPTRRP